MADPTPDDMTMPRPPNWARCALCEQELDIVLVQSNDKLCALLNRCSHCGALLHLGELLDDCIVCPQHGTRFRLDDGSLHHGPGAYPQPTLRARVRAGRVEIRVPRA